MRVALLPLCLGLSACAAQGPYPSLAPRAIERGLAGGLAPAPCLDGDGAETQVAAVAPASVPSDPQLRARLTALLAQARQGQSAFAEILPRASSSAARAGAAGSDAWIAAQQEISRLESARARTSDALAELDSLGIRRPAGGPVNEEDFQAVLQAEEEARALAERQEAELNRLTGLIDAP
jgi:hypothetical protein